jgi:hypothetical protein
MSLQSAAPWRFGAAERHVLLGPASCRNQALVRCGPGPTPEEP